MLFRSGLLLGFGVGLGHYTRDSFPEDNAVCKHMVLSSRPEPWPRKKHLLCSTWKGNLLHLDCSAAWTCSKRPRLDRSHNHGSNPTHGPNLIMTPALLTTIHANRAPHNKGSKENKGTACVCCHEHDQPNHSHAGGFRGLVVYLCCVQNASCSHASILMPSALS